MAEQVIEIFTRAPITSGKKHTDNEDETYTISISADTSLYKFLREDYSRLLDLRFQILDYNCFMKITWYIDVVDNGSCITYSCVGGQLLELLDICEYVEWFREKYGE